MVHYLPHNVKSLVLRMKVYNKSLSSLYITIVATLSREKYKAVWEGIVETEKTILKELNRT